MVVERSRANNDFSAPNPRTVSRAITLAIMGMGVPAGHMGSKIVKGAVSAACPRLAWPPTRWWAILGLNQ